MNPTNNPQQPRQEPSVEQWFNSLPSDQLITAPTPVDIPSPTPNKSYRKLIVIIVGMVTCLLLLASILFCYRYFTTDSCLSESDYTDLTGSELDEQYSLSNSFYVTSLPFKQDNVLADKAKVELKKLTDFYAKRKSTSIIFTLTSEYGADSLDTLASSRTNTLKDELVSGGVSVSDIRIQKASKIVSGGEISEDNLSSLTTNYITVSSSQKCR